MIPSTVVGQVTGTGAIINVSIGFKPDYVKLVNRTTGSMLEFFRASGATGSRKTVVAGTVTVVTGASSISDYAGSTAVGAGFVIPVDAQVNVNTQIIDYFASRSGPGAQ